MSHILSKAEDILCGFLADGRTAGADGVPRVGPGTRKKARAIVDALREARLLADDEAPPASAEESADRAKRLQRLRAQLTELERSLNVRSRERDRILRELADAS